MCPVGGALDTIDSVSAPHAPGAVGHAVAVLPPGIALIASDGAGFGTA